MEYKCEKCNKNYSSYQSLWIHNKKFHQSILTQVVHTTPNTDSTKEIKFDCEYCNKKFSRKNNMVRHQKTCKEKNKKENKDNELKNEILELKKTVQKLANKKVVKNYNSGTIINGITTNNSGIIINKLGTENLL